MKIITNHLAYVQKIDLEFLKYRLHSLPQSISSKIFENSEIDVDDFNKYDFFKFDDVSDIEFFKGIDWIIDYDSIRNLTDIEIKAMGRTYVERLEQITKILYKMTSDNKDYENVLLQYKLLHYQITSLNDILDFKSGLLKMTLPNKDNKLQKLIRIFIKRKN